MSYEIRHGDALSLLRQMPDESVNCCVTSPPYFGLRDYGCDGQIGLEPTPEAFIARLTEVFREVRRVLRSDGTCWVNIGDSYSGPQGAKNGNFAEWSKAHPSAKDGGRRVQPKDTPVRRIPAGMKPKDLIGVPWMLAFALRADGWYLRQDIIWHKPNPMPESVTDRCTKAHEYVFMLTKSARYSCDMGAVSERALQPAGTPSKSGCLKTDLFKHAGTLGSNQGAETRNKRSVWTLATLPTPDAHFATFPIELPETCILAGCPVDGVTLDPFCGAGTTGLAALKNGRRFIGLELNSEYIEIANTRARRHYPLLAGVA